MPSPNEDQRLHTLAALAVDSETLRATKYRSVFDLPLDLDLQDDITDAPRNLFSSIHKLPLNLEGENVTSQHTSINPSATVLPSMDLTDAPNQAAPQTLPSKPLKVCFQSLPILSHIEKTFRELLTGKRALRNQLLRKQ